MKDNDQESKAVELIKIAEADCNFFCDQHGTPFAFVNPPGSVLQLRAREFKTFLVKEYYTGTGEAVGTDAINAALNVLEAKATEAQRIKLAVRCNMDTERKLTIDLCNKQESAVVIDGNGWRVARLEVPTFRRYSHMLPMEIGDDSADLRDFVRFWKLKDQADDVLMAGYIGHMFVSEIPKAIHVAIGPKGSTKTSSQRYIRQLADPSSIEDMTIGEKGNEFVQQLAHHYVPLFDNVSKLQPWQADGLCRAATGAGFSKRSLYTDDDDVTYRYTRSVLVNGVNTPTQRGDFLDRALLFEYARVPKGERLEDSEVKRRMAEWLPRLRKSIFDALAVAIRNLEQVREDVKEKPRMADFAVWGEAFCRAIGYAPMEFYGRLMQKVDETSAIALENDVIADLLFKLFDEGKGRQYLTAKDRFEGTATELLKVLQHLNNDLSYVGEKELPASPESFGRRLGELEADLGELGIRVEKDKTTGGKRKLTVRRIREVPPEGNEKLPQPPQPPLAAVSHESEPNGSSGGSGSFSLSVGGEAP
jgi:hypothetical protein